MPMNSQLTSESTVSVLSRYLALSDLGHWLDRAQPRRGKSQCDQLASRELMSLDSDGCAGLSSPELALSIICPVFGDRLLESPSLVTQASERAPKPTA